MDDRRLRYWERLRLVRPRIRWGERFYDFGDLVALRTIKRLTDSRVPARRLRRAVSAIERQLGGSALRVENLRLLECRQSVAFVLPGEMAPPFDPLELQWILPLQGAPASSAASNVHQLGSRSAEEWFEIALAAETSPETVDEAVEAYQRVIEISPEWVEAHINLGVALYQMGRGDEARAEFLTAVQLDPLNGISRYNLGCVLEEQGEIDQAIEHLRRAVRALPAHADVHFNLALAYEKRGERRLAREQWVLYLRHAPNGAWVEQARAHLRQCSVRRKRLPPIPFPRKA